MLKLIHVDVDFLEEFGTVGVENVRFLMCLFDFFMSLDGSDVVFQGGVLDLSKWNT